jgi:hypothetical protein
VPQLAAGDDLRHPISPVCREDSAVLSEVTARMVAGHFALDDLGLHDLKGIARRCARASRAPGREAGDLWVQRCGSPSFLIE